MGVMDELIDAAAIEGLRGRLATAAPGVAFDHLLEAAQAVDGLALRVRTDLVAAALLADLPQDHTEVAAIVRRALADPGFAGWAIWPVTEATTTLALSQDDPAVFDDGLALLAELTPRLTGEFAIRRFLAADLDRALGVVLSWTRHPDAHVRRLASEGTRPYLPWAVRVPALTARPEATVPILDALHNDASEYVRRSVANHLNDLSRHAPDLVVERAAAWTGTGEVPWVVRHGTRTLVKKGHPATLALLGFAPATVTVVGPTIDADDVTTPGSIGITASVTNDGPVPARLAIDYVVHYVKADGRLAPKVFKLTTRTLDAGESVTVSTRHALRQMTTRVHHPGRHEVELQVNGQRYGRAAFELRTAP